jgi:DNA helicase II / ATP-dependent DNA helicase PcrA
MELVVDLHTHSHYSRATSKESNLEGLYKWGKIKGISVLGTGDFTHPGWFAEIREKLEPAAPGLFKLKEKITQKIDAELPESVGQRDILFVLTSEISNIYSKAGKVRKLHILVVAPNFETVSAINTKLETIGNLKADGRPILGLDSKELLKILLGINKDTLFVPAHIWTPWFSMYGSNSGFDSIKEAFEELAPEIKVVETGLSSDPYMNWRLDELQKVTIISNSDAHSPSKLGREATLVNADLDYFDIVAGLKSNDQRVIGTIEFFPQEGKYHYDGHREHNIRFTPQQTKDHQGICPVCHKPLTVGVDHRVDDLANHPEGYKMLSSKSVEYIIPLPEIMAEIKGSGPSSKAVEDLYHKTIAIFGNEFDILRKVPIEKIKQEGLPELGAALDKMRKGEIYIEPGFDGVYGTIKVFGNDEEKKHSSGQLSLL